MKLTNKKLMVIAVTFLGFAILFFSTSVINSNRQSIDNKPQDGVGIDITTQAYIVEGDKLLRDLGGTGRYENLSKDLFVFGNTAYAPYSEKDTELVGFKVLSSEKKDDQVIVSGKYGSSNNLIEIVAKPLKKDRILVSITDTSTKLNIDNFLPSNSKFNQFIGTLPIEKTGYTIDYIEESGEFTVNVFNNPSNYETAVKEIVEALEIESSESLKIIRYGVVDGGIINGEFR